MTKEEIRQQFDSQIEFAKKIVESWPSWKQNILVQSARSTVATPRPQVNNQVATSELQSASK